MADLVQMTMWLKRTDTLTAFMAEVFLLENHRRSVDDLFWKQTSKACSHEQSSPFSAALTGKIEGRRDSFVRAA
jgi:hypothetical protein